MLTLTTKLARLQQVVKGEIKEDYREITPYWTKRIVNLLGFGESDEQTIINNLRENRKGTTEAEREVLFSAGGAICVRAVVTVSIGEGRREWGAAEGVEYFVLKIREIKEITGMSENEKNISGEDPEVIEGEVVGNPNAPAVRKLIQTTGICRYCNQARIIEAPEGLSGESYNDIASEECECDEAVRQRERRQRMEAAGMWAKNTFSKTDGQLQVALCSIKATFEGSVDYVTLKIGKNTHKIDRDSDGMIRIRTTYRDSNEETF